MPPRRRAGAQVAAVRADLGKLPEDLRGCAEAVAAVALAMNVDAGVMVTTSVRELRATLAGLRARATAIAMAEKPLVRASETVKESPVADLSSRIRAVRRGSSAG